jgi:hypothetical protein
MRTRKKKNRDRPMGRAAKEGCLDGIIMSMLRLRIMSRKRRMQSDQPLRSMRMDRRMDNVPDSGGLKRVA